MEPDAAELMEVARELYAALRNAEQRVMEADADAAAARQEATTARSELEVTCAAAQRRQQQLERLLLEADSAAQAAEAAEQTAKAQQEQLAEDALTQRERLAAVEETAARWQQTSRLWEGRCTDMQQQLSEERVAREAAASEQRAAAMQAAEWRAAVEAAQEETKKLRNAAAHNLRELSSLCRLVQVLRASLSANANSDGSSSPLDSRCGARGGRAAVAAQRMEAAILRILDAHEHAAGLPHGVNIQPDSNEPEAEAEVKVMVEPVLAPVAAGLSQQHRKPTAASPASSCSGMPEQEQALRPDGSYSLPWSRPPSADAKPQPALECIGTWAASPRQLLPLPSGRGGTSSSTSGPGLVDVVATLECEVAALDLEHGRLLKEATGLGTASSSRPTGRQRDHVAAAAQRVRTEMRLKGKQLQQLRAWQQCLEAAASS